MNYAFRTNAFALAIEAEVQDFLFGVLITLFLKGDSLESIVVAHSRSICPFIHSVCFFFIDRLGNRATGVGI